MDLNPAYDLHPGSLADTVELNEASHFYKDGALPTVVGQITHPKDLGLHCSHKTTHSHL